MFSNSKSADTKVYDTAIDLFYNLRKSYFWDMESPNGITKTDLRAGSMYLCLVKVEFSLNVIISGIEEARSAGKVLKQNGYQFDIVYLSVLTRAI